ncbi:hypothetical protein IQ283_14700 [Alkalihalobacillus hwajinpoensis]|uniref:hypothetical protein n=1 Tax=Guptibacillus hwajinpoensis TaxID=208199 RepID=UPI00188445C7|nr:hypothetical protein [Pseudalkalibacillus hwajinpoensis]MBF0707845.1 hypothetical protein [Pseudalkalibacillus hwajinpoensis]
MEDTAFWIMIGGGLLSLIAWGWYYASLGKRIAKEEEKAGRDLTYEINPYTGSSHGVDSKKKQDRK